MRPKETWADPHHVGCLAVLAIPAMWLVTRLERFAERLEKKEPTR